MLASQRLRQGAGRASRPRPLTPLPAHRGRLRVPESGCQLPLQGRRLLVRRLLLHSKVSRPRQGRVVAILARCASRIGEVFSCRPLFRHRLRGVRRPCHKLVVWMSRVLLRPAPAMPSGRKRTAHLQGPRAYHEGESHLKSQQDHRTPTCGFDKGTSTGDPHQGGLERKHARMARWSWWRPMQIAGLGGGPCSTHAECRGGLRLDAVDGGMVGQAHARDCVSVQDPGHR